MRSPEAANAVDVAVIGAGFSGLCTAIKLKRAGVKSFVVLEKALELGGVWRDNTYPGAACDIPSMLYSLSFQRKPDWRRRFASQREIWDYMLQCAQDNGIRPHLRLATEVVRCQFEAADGFWRLHAADSSVVVAKALIVCVGQLNRPAVPRLDGISSFRGPAFHSSCWDHSVDLAGKSVAVVGTGASAIQVVPSIVERVARLKIFQRSPPWIVPKPDRPYTVREHWAFRHVPLAARIARLRTYLAYERAHAKVKTGSKLNRQIAVTGRDLIERQVSDPALRKSLLPDYAPGCKRILLSNDWYPAVARPHVDLVTSDIARVTPEGIETADGRSHPVDVIIFCTGFQSTDFLVPMEVVGRHGQRLHDRWKGGAEAYRGTAVPGFPNLFMVYGPNTTVPNSAIFMMECQTDYIMKLVKKVLRRDAVLEVREEIARAYNDDIQEKAKAFAWTSGCHNWFVSQSGKLINNWPASTLRFFMLTRWLDLRSYHVERRPRMASEVAATSFETGGMQ